MNTQCQKVEPLRTMPNCTQSSRCSAIKKYLLEFGPLAWVIFALWMKLIYFSLSMREVWWAEQQSIGVWVRLYPEIFSGTLASLLLLFGLIPLLQRIWSVVLVLIINLCLTLLIVSDLVHLDYYGDVFSVSRFAQIQQVPWVIYSIIELLQPIHAIFFIDIIISAVIFCFYLHLFKMPRAINRKKLMLLSFGLILFGFLLSIPTLQRINQDPTGIFAYTNVQREVATVTGLLPYHFIDLISHLGPDDNKISEAKVKQIRDFLNSKKKQQGANSNLFGIAKNKNVILISAESLQTFPIGLEIDGQAITPRLSQFAKESLFFVNYFDQTYLGTTADGAFITLQSLHPLPVGVVASDFPTNHYYGLPEILTKHGYKTLSAIAAPPEFWNMNLIFPQLGFQQSYYEDYYEPGEYINSWLNDKEFFTQTVPILESQQEPFMAFLLSSSNHHPFDLSEKYRALNFGKFEGSLFGKYLHTVHYFDQAFGEFIDELEKTGMLENSVIVLYGDHEGVGGPDELAEFQDLSKWSKIQDLLNSKRVPLIIRLPNRESAGIKKVVGGHLDVTPTILSLLGVSEDDMVVLGRDLTTEENDMVVFRDGSFINGAYYLINHFGAISKSICYEIESGQRVDCNPLDGQRRKALEQLEVSDLIIRGNLIPLVQANEDELRPPLGSDFM